MKRKYYSTGAHSSLYTRVGRRALSSLLAITLPASTLSQTKALYLVYSARVVVSRASRCESAWGSAIGVVTHKGCSTPTRLPSVHSHSLATRAYTPSSPLPAHSRSAAGGRRGRTRFACDRDIAGSRSGWRSGWRRRDGEMEGDRNTM